MINGAYHLPIQHISIRVPWHDAGWTGKVCDNPAGNTACRILPGISETKNDADEADIASTSLEDLPEEQLPPCVNERATFMAPFPITITKSHPYAEYNNESHHHFRPTQYRMRPYTAACVPFRWMLKTEAEGFVDRYDIGYQPEREPDLSFGGDWIQEHTNQLIMLDTFFSAVQPNDSLCFFYAKDTPLSASIGRVIIGVGLVRAVDRHIEYNYSTSNPSLRSVIWERNVEHSIRPRIEDGEGFLFPYQEVLDIAAAESLDPEQFLALAPDDALESFSYASEHVSHDHAIATILNCIRALEQIETILTGPWKHAKDWLDQQLNRLWRMRGPFPGFGSALAAFLGNGGNLVAYEIAKECAEDNSVDNSDPWTIFERIIKSPDEATDSIKEIIGGGFARTWNKMSSTRKELLKLLSRFSLSTDQAERFFDPDQRPENIDDESLLSNPYLLYELDRMSADSIAVMTIDRGMLPDKSILEAQPLPERSRLEDKVDSRRVRALMVAALEQGATQGHTLLPRRWLTDLITDMPLGTDCPVGSDVLDSLDDFLDGIIKPTQIVNDGLGYQLERFVKTGNLIQQTVQKRTGSKSNRHKGGHRFRSIVDSSFGKLPPDPDDAEIEERARTEKAKALSEIFRSRFSVLIGAAGTGKTTLLKLLCELEDVSSGGILLLAPTGKARVQLEKKTGMDGGLTIAQFLIRHGGRYDPLTGQYSIIGNIDRCQNYRTVIVDECSMLTEEQLAALLDGLSRVDRLVLVGDPRQLPPIGSGRPFVDIVQELKPEGVEYKFPRVGRGYAELTVPRRQQGIARADLLLADWFGGTSDPAADEIWDRLKSDDEMEEIHFESWTDGGDLEQKLFSLIVQELKLSGIDDEAGFECSLGGTIFGENGNVFFWRSQNEDDPPKAEQWQIISPVRAAEHGVDFLNHIVQQTFRKAWLSRATKRYRKINQPLGPQGIIYGDKVINLENSSQRNVWPERESYVANGDVGLVVGNYKTNKQARVFKQLEVEFTSQPAHAYTFKASEFSGEEMPPLDLAYALTVHKTQGSEFGTTFVVLPNPCWLLSRELMYTALTRQQKRIIILHQGDVHELRQYASDEYSDTAQRLTNLFSPPNLISFDDKDGKKRFLEERLIHHTKRGDLVRSKSEVIIANELLAQGIDDYEYEAVLKLPNGKMRYPDFTIIDADSGRYYYWEHLGLLHDPNYAARWKQKLALYREADILPYEEGGGDAGTLIITQDDENGAINSKRIAEIISDISS